MSEERNRRVINAIQQCDREMAAANLPYSPEYNPALIRGGNADECPTVQAFAAHRLATIAECAAAVDELARPNPDNLQPLKSEYDKGWRDCAAMARQVIEALGAKP